MTHSRDVLDSPQRMGLQCRLRSIPTTLFINRKGETIARLEGRGKSGELSAAAKNLFRD